MIRLSFTETDITKFDWSDVLNDTFVRPYELDSEYCHSGIVWHIIGSDVIIRGAQKNSSIHNDWENGHDLWGKLNFAIITRPSYILCDGDLPPKHMIIKARICGSSSIIRNAIRVNYDLSKLLPSDVIDYIIGNKLYDYTQ